MKVSVSVTAYNHEQYIAQALDSVLMQKADFDYEIVVGDDCSTDRTRDLVLDYQRRFPERIRTVFPARNLGDGGKLLFVETVLACRGEFVAMLDGDDYWTVSDKLQRQAVYLDNHPECSMCYHNAVIADGSEPPRKFNPPDQPPFSTTADVLWFCFIASCSPMIRREVLDPFPPWYFASPWGDWAMYLIAAERGLIGYIDSTMGAYRVHEGGIWSGLDSVEQMEHAILRFDTIDENLRAAHRKTIARIVAWEHYRLACAQAQRGRSWAAVRALWASICSDPAATQAGHRRLLRAAVSAIARR